jgi:hypothetical protein
LGAITIRRIQPGAVLRRGTLADRTVRRPVDSRWCDGLRPCRRRFLLRSVTSSYPRCDTPHGRHSSYRRF